MHSVPRFRLLGLLLLCGVVLLSGCGTTWQGLLSGGLNGAQEHELRQRPLHRNGLN